MNQDAMSPKCLPGAVPDVPAPPGNFYVVTLDGLDGAYPRLKPGDANDTERREMAAVMMACRDMRDRHGHHRPFHVPPAVALAIVRRLFMQGIG